MNKEQIKFTDVLKKLGMTVGEFTKTYMGHNSNRHGRKWLSKTGSVPTSAQTIVNLLLQVQKLQKDNRAMYDKYVSSRAGAL